MSQNRTTPTASSVDEFLASVENETRRRDGQTVVEIMRRVTGAEPRMWGGSIIGFGSYHYRYESGHEGDSMRVGFSPRKANLVLYLTRKGANHEELLQRLGKHRVGASCMYVNRLSDVDTAVLEEMIEASWKAADEAYGPAE